MKNDLEIFDEYLLKLSKAKIGIRRKVVILSKFLNKIKNFDK